MVEGYKKCSDCSEEQRSACNSWPVRKLECTRKEIEAAAANEKATNYARGIDKYPRDRAAMFHEDKDKNGTLIIRNLGEAIVKLDRFLHFRDTDDLSRFDGRVYHEHGDQYIHEVCNYILGGEYSTQRANETVSYIRTLSDGQIQHIEDHTQLVAPPNLMPFKNGVYDIGTSSLRPYNSDIPFFNHLPMEYDATADCPRFKQFLGEIIDPGDVDVIQEWLGYCLYRNYPIAKSLLLVGKGRNGKTVLLNVINRMVGPGNVSHVSLQQLTTNRFAMANLYNKYVNTFADLPDKAVYETGNFKILTGNDPITAEKKNKPFFNFYNYAKPTFSCNKIPESYDESDAFYERLIIVTCPNQFLGEKADEHLGEKLKAELPGIINFALQGLRRLLTQHSFSQNKSLEETRKYYKRHSSTIAAYVEDCLEIDAESKIKKETLYNDYVAYCKRVNVVALHRDVFAKKLPHEVEVSSTQMTEEKGRPRAWAGIRFRAGPTDLAEGESIDDYTDTRLAKVDCQNAQPTQPTHLHAIPQVKLGSGEKEGKMGVQAVQAVQKSAQPTHPSSVTTSSNSIKVNCKTIQPSQPFEVLNKRSESGEEEGKKVGQVGQVGQKEEKKDVQQVEQDNKGTGDVDTALLTKFEAYLEREKSVGATKAAKDLGIQEDELALLSARSGKVTWFKHGTLDWSPVKLPRGEKLIADCHKCGSKRTIHVPQDQVTAMSKCVKCGEEYKFSKLKIHCRVPNCNATYTDWFPAAIPMGNQRCALCKTVGFLEVLKEDGK